MGPLLAVRPFKLHQSTRERATFVKWICESASANTLERGGNLSLSSSPNGPDFCLQYPGRGDVSNYLPSSLPSSSLLYVDFIARVRLSSAVRGGQCCFAGKVSKSRYTSSISVSCRKEGGEGEWNEFHAQASRVVYCVIVQIASGASENATHSGNAPAIISPHFK